MRPWLLLGPPMVSRRLWGEGREERFGSAEGEGKNCDASEGRQGHDEGRRGEAVQLKIVDHP